MTEENHEEERIRELVETCIDLAVNSRESSRESVYREEGIDGEFDDFPGWEYRRDGLSARAIFLTSFPDNMFVTVLDEERGMPLFRAYELDNLREKEVRVEEERYGDWGEKIVAWREGALPPGDVRVVSPTENNAADSAVRAKRESRAERSAVRRGQALKEDRPSSSSFGPVV